MSFSVQYSIVESCSFNGKHVRCVYVKDVGQCLVSTDVYEAIGYDKKDGVKAIQPLVPEKYKIRFGDAQFDLEGVDNFVHTQPNTILLKEPGYYCFLFRCKRDEAEPLMIWVVETVLPREVRKLASVIKGKDNQIQAHKKKILRLNEDHQQAIEEKDTTIPLLNNGLKNCEHDNVALQAQKDLYKKQLQKCQDIIARLKKRHVSHAKDLRKMNFMSIPTTLQEYNNDSLTQKSDGLKDNI